MPLRSVVDLAPTPVSPARFSEEEFDLFSIPAYDAGQAETLPGSAIRSSKNLVSPADVLFSKLNPRIPRAWLVPPANGRRRQISSTEFLPLRVRDATTLDPDYLRWMLLAPQFLAPVQAAVNSSTRSHQRIRPELLLEQHIPIRSFPEQRRIVGCIVDLLSRVDEVKRLREEARTETRALLMASIDALLDVNWPLRSIRELAHDIRNGWSGKASRGGRELRILRLSCVHGLHIDVNESKAIVLDEEVGARFQIYKDDVFLVRGNGSKHLVGRSAIALEDNTSVIFNDLLIRIRFRDLILPAFANITLHSTLVRRQIERSAKTAAGIWKINQRGVNAIELPWPPLGEQQRVLGEFNRARSLCSEIQRALEPGPVDSLSDAILRKAFAGEL